MDKNQAVGSLSLLFGTPVWVVQNPEHPQQGRKIEAIVRASWRSGRIDVAKTNSYRLRPQEDNQTESGRDLVLINIQNLVDLSSDPFVEISAFINDAIGQIIKPGLSWRIEAWVNTQPTGARNNQHLHAGGCCLSGVYYVSLPVGAGRLIVHDPRKVAVHAAFSSICRAKLHPDAVPVQPAEGMLVIFPSWLEHSVEENKSDDLRISLAFNVFLEGRNCLD